MFGVETLSGNVAAGATVALVLGEAVALYLGYGALTRTLGPAVHDAIRGGKR